MASRNITTVKFVCEMMKNENLPIWRAYHSDGKTSLCFQLKKIPLNDSIDMLRETVKNTSGIMVLKLYKDPEKAEDEKKNQYSFYEYTIDMDEEKEGSGAKSQDNGISGLANNNSMLALFLAEMQKNLTLQLEANRKDFDYQRKLEAVTKGSDQLKNQMQIKVLDKLMSILEGGKKAQVPAAAAATIAGTPEAGQDKAAPSAEVAAKRKVAQTLNTLRKDDPDFYKKLEKLALMKTKNPAMYEMVTDSLKDLELE